MVRILPVVLVVLLALPLGAECSPPLAKKRNRTSVFQVPTTGKIMDVTYHPEFDEWWIKCREGDDISVYTYDTRSREWGKVRFTTKKPGGQERPVEKPGETVGRDREQQKQDQPIRHEEPKSEPKKEPGKEQDSSGKRWWDPIRLLKQGDKLIHPFHREP